MDRQGLSMYMQIETCIYRHTQIYTYVYLHIHTYTCTRTRRHMGCTKLCSEFLPALQAKSKALPCIRGSANIQIFIRELMQEKTSECRRGGQGMLLPAEDGKL